MKRKILFIAVLMIGFASVVSAQSADVWDEINWPLMLESTAVEDTGHYPYTMRSLVCLIRDSLPGFTDMETLLALALWAYFLNLITIVEIIGLCWVMLR